MNVFHNEEDILTLWNTTFTPEIVQEVTATQIGSVHLTDN